MGNISYIRQYFPTNNIFAMGQSDTESPSSLHFTNEAYVLDELVNDHHQRDDKKGDDNE